MANFSFDIEGLEELERDLRNVIKEHPVEMKEELRGIAKDFKKTCMEKTPDGKYHKGDAKTKLLKKYGIRMVDEGMTQAALVFNSARHFHLVENGHELIIHGKRGKFVSGKHMMEETRDEYKDVVPERFEKITEKILERNNL